MPEFKESNNIDFAIVTVSSAATLGILALKNFVDTQCEYAKNYKAPSVIAASISPAVLQIDQLHQALNNLKLQSEQDQSRISDLAKQVKVLEKEKAELAHQLHTQQSNLITDEASSSINNSMRK